MAELVTFKLYAGIAGGVLFAGSSGGIKVAVRVSQYSVFALRTMYVTGFPLNGPEQTCCRPLPGRICPGSVCRNLSKTVPQSLHLLFTCDHKGEQTGVGGGGGGGGGLFSNADSTTLCTERGALSGNVPPVGVDGGFVVVHFTGQSVDVGFIVCNVLAVG